MVQASVVTPVGPAEYDVCPITLAYPSQSVVVEVTLMLPCACVVSVKALENVDVTFIPSAYIQSKEELLQACNAALQFDAYAAPVPVLGRDVIVLRFEVFVGNTTAPIPEATYPPKPLGSTAAAALASRMQSTRLRSKEGSAKKENILPVQ